MTDSTDSAAAKARLAASRTEMLAAMGFEALPDATVVGRNEIRLVHSVPGARGTEVPLAVSRWWRTHPLNDAVQLARPFLETHARREPGKLIAFGAGLGALLWIFKPWKLLSVATVATILLHNVDIAGTVSTVVRKFHRPPA